jgi:hypothetical protein
VQDFRQVSGTFKDCVRSLPSQFLFFPESTEHAYGLGARPPSGSDIDRGVSDHQAGVGRHAKLTRGQFNRIRIRLRVSRAKGRHDRTKVPLKAMAGEECHRAFFVPCADDSEPVSAVEIPQHCGHAGDKWVCGTASGPMAMQPIKDRGHFVIDIQAICKPHKSVAR